MSNKKIKHY